MVEEVLGYGVLVDQTQANLHSTMMKEMKIRVVDM